MDDNKFMIWVVSIICSCIVAVAVVLTVYVYFDDKLFIEAGYTRATLPGAGVHWVKPEGKGE